MAYPHVDALFNTSFPKGTGVELPVLRSVAQVLCQRAYSSTGRCFPSVPGISRHAQVGEDSTRDALDVLELLGLFRAERRTLASGGDTSSLYTLRNTMEVSWLTNGEEKHGVAFRGWCTDEDGGPWDGNYAAAPPPWPVRWEPIAYEVRLDEVEMEPPRLLKVRWPSGDEMALDERHQEWPHDRLWVVWSGYKGTREEPGDKEWVAYPFGEYVGGRVADSNSPLADSNPGDAHSNPAPCQEQPSPSLWAVLPLADSKGGGVLPATQISKLESVSRPVMRTLKAERAIKKEWGFAPSSSTDPFHYERKKKVEEEGERRILTPEELD